MAIENIKIANGTAVPVKDVEAHSLIASLTSTVEGLTSTVNGKPTFANIPNKNLLDNWYFANPINQRGATTYTANGFTIDRWYLALWSTISPSVAVLDGCVAISCTPAAGDTNSTYLRQTLECPKQLSGKTVTLSAKLKNTTVDGDARLIIYYETSDGTTSRKYTAITTAKANSVVSVTTTLPGDLTVVQVEIGNDANSGGDGNFNIEIESMKLELGSVSTLANDAPPNYTEELLKCQRYFWKSSGYNAYPGYKSTTAYAFIQTPVQMRTAPSVTLGSMNYIYSANGRAVFNGTDIATLQQQGQFIRLTLDESKADSAQSSYTGYTFVTGESGISLSADL